MALYEQNDEVSGFRQGLGITALFILVVVVLGTLVWLIFYRHPAPKVATKHGSAVTRNHSSDTHSADGATTNPSTPGGTPTAPSGTSPTQLANTGAGNIMVPFTVAGVAGSVLYYVRLRRKLLS